MAEFTFDPAFKHYPNTPELDNTERGLIRDLCKPGFPVWKILRQLADYREGLKEALTDPEQNLDDPEVRRALKTTQVTIAAINEIINRFVQSAQEEK